MPEGYRLGAAQSDGAQGVNVIERAWEGDDADPCRHQRAPLEAGSGGSACASGAIPSRDCAWDSLTVSFVFRPASSAESVSFPDSLVALRGDGTSVSPSVSSSSRPSESPRVSRSSTPASSASAPPDAESEATSAGGAEGLPMASPGSVTSAAAIPAVPFPASIATFGDCAEGSPTGSPDSVTPASPTPAAPWPRSMAASAGTSNPLPADPAPSTRTLNVSI